MEKDCESGTSPAAYPIRVISSACMDEKRQSTNAWRQYSRVGCNFRPLVRFVSLKGNRKREVKTLTSRSKPGVIPGPL